jgi:hypothetical protein
VTAANDQGAFVTEVAPLRAVADRLAIHELLALYGHLLDDLAHDRFTEVFSFDAEFDLSAYDLPDLKSVAAIAAAFQVRNMAT